MTQNAHLLSQIAALAAVGDMETAKEAMKLLTEPESQAEDESKPGGDFPDQPPAADPVVNQEL